MTLETLAKNVVDHLKFGEKKATYEFPNGSSEGAIIHVSGPTEDKHLGNFVDLFPFVGKFLNRTYRDVETYCPEDRKAPFDAVRRVGDAYLDGSLSWPAEETHASSPLNSTLFLLRLNREKLNSLISKVQTLDEVTMTGVEEYPLNRMDTQRGFPRTAGVDEAVQYLKDLVFWNLDWNDYSDYVNITVTERTKQVKGRKKTALVVERYCSKANNYNSRGIYAPVFQGTEKVVISGFAKE